MGQDLLERQPGETDKDIIFRVSLHKDQIGTWQDIADALNAALDTPRSAESYRHIYRRERDAKQREAKENPQMVSEEPGIIQYLENYGFAKQRQKLRDERSAIAKYARNEARLELRLDAIEEIFKDIRRLYPPDPDAENARDDLIRKATAVDTKSKAMIIMLSDWHIGARFSGQNNSFDKDIAVSRVERLLLHCVKYIHMYGVDKVAVVLMGDMISGNIHQNTQLENQLNVVDQMKTACSLVADFIYELSRCGPDIDVYSIAGNHSRLGKKEDVLADERLDNFIPWYLQQVLDGTNHIKVHSVDDGNTVKGFLLNGKKYLIVHGDYDENTPVGMSRLILYAQEIPYAILTAHKHTPAVNMVNDIYVVQGGCLSGSGDNFTKEKRLNGKAYQMVLIDDGDQLISCPVLLTQESD